MARMGQTFSQSMGHIKVPQFLTNINDPEEDISGGQMTYLDVSDVMDNKSIEKAEKEGPEITPYTFSDGIGRISIELANEVCCYCNF